MSRNAAAVLMLSALLVPCSLAAQDAPSSAAGLTCIERLEMPQFPRIAQALRVRPDIEASLILKVDGSVETTRLSSSAPASVVKLFEPEINRAIRSSRFSANCTTRVVTVVFQFRLTGNVDDDFRGVAFIFPNRFEIVASEPRVEGQIARPDEAASPN
jgi:hypothetical protein